MEKFEIEHRPKEYPGRRGILLSLRTVEYFVSSLAVVAVTVLLYWSGGGREIPEGSSGTIRGDDTHKRTPRRVFCYGDSLTAGMSPPGHVFFPYATSLEKALKDQAPHGVPPPIVSWKGYPGWTSEQLATKIEKHLEPTVADNEEPVLLDLVIVLAGTNDLRHKPNSTANRDAIVGWIQEIHKAARRRAIPTIALAIPPSGFHSGVGDMAGAVNEELRSWADNVGTTYAPFPIDYNSDDATGMWSIDKLHLSEDGYEFLGTSLAPIVAGRLWSDKTL